MSGKTNNLHYSFCTAEHGQVWTRSCSSSASIGHPDPSLKQKKLFTPGPLGVSMSTKQAMLVDLGSRDEAFIRIVRSVRDQLVDLAGESHDEFTCIPVQVQCGG